MDLGSALPLNVQHGCNGGFLALQQVIGANNSARKVLLVSADNFSHSGFSRWNADYGLIYGDAAVSTLFDPYNGFAEILFFHTQTLPELETLHRCETPHCESEGSWLRDYDIKATKKHFLEQKSHQSFMVPILSCLESMKEKLIQETNADRTKIKWLVAPFVGNSVREATYEKVFMPLCSRSFWSEGRQFGHTGASDAMIGFYQQLNYDQLEVGDQVLLVSAGAGFSCSVMLLEITSELLQRRTSYD